MTGIHSSSSLSFWQSNIWRDMLIDSHQAYDARIFNYWVEALLIEFRPIGIGMMGAFSLGVDFSLYSEIFLLKCREYVSSMGAIFWQVEEYLPAWKPAWEKIPLSTYWKAFLEPWTRILDLSKSEEELQKEMHEKCRYNIKLAWKRGIRVNWVDPTDDHIDMWMELLSETTNRDGFASNSRAYYISFLRTLHDANAWGLMFAWYNGRIIAAAIYVYHHSTAVYYYGASTSDPELRKHMAPYMLQWEAIREAKLRWCRIYDFLGIAPPGDTDHPLSGVTTFKERFWGTAIQIGEKRLYIESYIRFLIFIPLRLIKNLFRKVYKTAFLR